MTVPSITGSITNIKSSSASGSQSITVPSDATFCLVMTAFWEGGVPDYSTLTLGGTSFTKVVESASDSYECSNIYRLASPATGSRTFAWSWASAPDEGAHIFVVFLKDVNTSAPITDSDTAANNPGSGVSTTTPSITTSTNDLLLIVGSGYGVTAADAGVSGQTEVADGGNYNSTYGVVGTKAGVSGTTTMAVTWTGSGMACSVCAVSVAGSTGGTTHNATATMAGTSSATTVGKNSIPFAATLAGTSSLTSVGKNAIPLTATLAGTSSLTVAGKNTNSFTATMAGTSAVSAIGKNAIPFIVTMAGTSSLTVIGTTTGIVEFTATMAGTSAVTVVGKNTIPFTATIAGTSSLTVVGGITGQVDFTATMAGTSSVTAAGKNAIPFSSTMAGTSSLTALGINQLSFTSTMAGTSVLTAIGKNTIPFTTTMAGESSLVVVGTATGLVDFSATMDGTSSLIVIGETDGTVIDFPRPHKRRKSDQDFIDEQKRIMEQIREKKRQEEMSQVNYLSKQLAQSEVERKQLEQRAAELEAQVLAANAMGERLGVLRDLLTPQQKPDSIKATSSIQRAQQERERMELQRQSEIKARNLANLEKARQARAKNLKKKNK